MSQFELWHELTIDSMEILGCMGVSAIMINYESLWGLYDAGYSPMHTARILMGKV
jgi:hypothetical protein